MARRQGFGPQCGGTVTGLASEPLQDARHIIEAIGVMDDWVSIVPAFSADFLAALH